ncbi:MAG: hypothetical protein JNN15_04960 [Blastocatellia bacterium]|nr:hypothetical protein [Blastocatellia bacterium]
MKLEINLSSRPFYNRRPFWLAFFVLLSPTLFAGYWVLKEIDQREGTVERLERRVEIQKSELEKLQEKRVSGALSLTDEQIRDLQATAVLIKQRTFSWTKMLEQLEESLAPTVRINSIKLKSASKEKADQIAFSINVLARTPEDVTKMVAQMDKRRNFYVDIKSQKDTKAGELSFDLDVIYLGDKKIDLDKEIAKAGSAEGNIETSGDEKETNKAVDRKSTEEDEGEDEEDEE